MTTRRDLNELSALGSRAVSLARAELQAFFFGLDLSRPEMARNALLEFMPVLAQEYGDAAAVAAAEWYESARAAEVGGRYAAVLGDTVPDAQVRGSVRYAAGHLFGENPTEALAVLSGALQRFVLAGARGTVGVNAGRDRARPRFARVPTGVRTCAWCEMLSSRGFVYHSKETAGVFASDFHDDCDCMIVSSWEHPNIDGYDSEAMYSRYLAAREASGSKYQQDIVAEMRRMFPDQYTDGVVPST